jgi:hypothetical protein
MNLILPFPQEFFLLRCSRRHLIILLLFLPLNTTWRDHISAVCHSRFTITVPRRRSDVISVTLAYLEQKIEGKVISKNKRRIITPRLIGRAQYV